MDTGDDSDVACGDAWPIHARTPLVNMQQEKESTGVACKEREAKVICD